MQRSLQVTVATALKLRPAWKIKYASCTSPADALPAIHAAGHEDCIHFAYAMPMDFNKGVEIEAKLALPTDVTMKL
jgi:hypothetical protein